MVEAIRANGWRQGSIFPSTVHSALQAHTKNALGETDCCIVISQSCDLLCRDPDAEPVVELVVARRLNSPLDGNYTHTKNARRMHFHVDLNGIASGFDAQIRDRFNVPRALLGDHRPDAVRKLGSTELNEIINWILARYSRVAFPDEFNRRVGAVVERKIKPVLRGLTKLQSIYVALSSWDELGPGEKYSVHVLGTVSVEDFEAPAIREAMESGLGKIAAALNGCEGVSVDNSEVQSEAQVTVDFLRTLARWNFDYISLRDPDEHRLPRRVL